MEDGHDAQKKQWSILEVYPGAAVSTRREALEPFANCEPETSEDQRRRCRTVPAARLQRARRMVEQSEGTKAVLAYGRMSARSKNGANCRSADQQIEICKFDAPRHGLEIVGCYTDENVSGISIEDRPSFKRMLSDVRRLKVQGIITADISRLGRTAALTVPLIDQLYRSGVEIFVVGVGKISKEAAMSQALAAEQSVAYISYATALAMKHLVIDGKNASRPPYGFRADPERRGGLVVVPEEEAFLRKVAAELMQGKGVAEVLRSVNKRGFRTRAGKLWSHQNLIGTLRYPGILRSPIAAGRLVYNRSVWGMDPHTGKRISDPLPIGSWTVGERPGPTIFTTDEFDALQALFSQGVDRHPPGPGPSTFLRGRCRCHTCGGIMVSHGGGYVRCRANTLGGDCDDESSYKRTRIEDLVIARVEESLSDGSLDEMAAAEYERRSENRAAIFRSDLREAESRLATIRSEIRNVREAARRGTVPDVWLAEDLEILRRNEIEAEDRFHRLSGDALDMAPDVAAIERVRSGFADIRRVLAEGEGADLTNEASTALSELVDEVRVLVDGDFLQVSVRGLIAFDEVVFRSGAKRGTETATRRPAAANA